MSAWSRLESPSAVSTLFAKICPVLTSAIVHLDSMETPTLCVKVMNFILEYQIFDFYNFSKAFYIIIILKINLTLNNFSQNAPQSSASAGHRTKLLVVSASWPDAQSPSLAQVAPSASPLLAESATALAPRASSLLPEAPVKVSYSFFSFIKCN